MDPLRTLLPFFLVLCSKAENLLEVRGELGQNATLNCSVDIWDVYWYVEISSGIRVHVAQSFTSDHTEAAYCSPSFRTKYLAKGNQLVVTNVSTQDLRLYSCSTKQGGVITEVNAFWLSSDVPHVGHNNSEENQQKNMCKICQNQVLVYASLVLNVLLVSMTTGFLSTLPWLKKRQRRSLVSDPPPLSCDRPDTLETPQYEEIQMRHSAAAAPPLECIYSKAQLPHT